MARRWLMLFAAVMGLSGCAATPRIEPDPAPPEVRAVSRENGPVTVKAAALGADESEQRLGVSLHDSGIQSVWIEVDNRDVTRYWLFPIAIDHDYFIPSEVLRRVGGRRPPPSLVERIESMSMPAYIPPGTRRSGLIYVRAEEGLKAVTVQLMTPGHRRDFPFVLVVPGLKRPPVASKERIYPLQTLADLDDQALIDYVKALPCCGMGPRGEPADPINFVLVGSLDLVRLALASRGWSLAEVASSSSSMRMAWAFITQTPLRNGPVSDIQFYGRAQDVAFQKSREIVAERNHLRLWLAPVTWRAEPVWVGQISRDVGVKLSGRFWPPTTHEIDPAVDEARYYLLQDLMASRLAARLTYAAGVGAARRNEPRLNAEGDPYFTDGLRWITVLRLPSAESTTIELFGDHYPDPPN